MSNIVQLDVRPVEPKDRFERIMGTYSTIPEGGTLELTVDHDPKCMYYTLQAEHGEGSFKFEYIEDGPEVWRVHVRRIGAGQPSPAA
ncbi:MAG: DUF2249 domain-containing protein [Gemmatimonadaceae bacterium]|nr:DUF2249 domain-containing protein [Gemmatimonadaceae bacterium]